MSYRLFRPPVAALSVALVTLVACDDTASVQATTTLEVLMTDAPSSQFIAQARVDIGAVELIGGAGGPVVLSEDGTEGPVDLMELRNTATTSLALTAVPVGRYQQLRMVVESASVTLLDGYVFGNNTPMMELTVPSGAQTGLKLNLGGLDPASSDDGQNGAFLAPGSVAFVVDFDVDRSFVLQGGPDEPGGFAGATLTPTIRLSLADVAGSISGRITTSLPEVEVGGLVVIATPLVGASLEPSQTDEATAVTDGGGAFSMSFLMPGDYEVSVEVEGGLGAESVRVTVPPGGAVTEVALVLLES